MKNIIKTFLFLFFTVFLFSCKQDIDSNNKHSKDRIAQLISIAETGNYKISDEQIESDLINVLNSFKYENSRNANNKNWIVKKLYDEKVDVTVSYNRSLEASATSDNICYKLYETSNGETSGFAVCSDDIRVGSVLSISEETFCKDISDNTFLQFFVECLEDYTNETMDIWNEITNNEESSRSAYSSLVASGEWDFSGWKKNSGNLNNILSTKWSQSPYYNDAIKFYYGKNYPTGCGNTAMAQIMAFHEFPTFAQPKTLEKLG